MYISTDAGRLSSDVVWNVDLAAGGSVTALYRLPTGPGAPLRHVLLHPPQQAEDGVRAR